MLYAANKRLLMETDWPGCRKGMQFAAFLSCYGLPCWADRVILAPLFGYQGLMYQSATTRAQRRVAGLILPCTAFTAVRYRQPFDGVLYMLLPLVVIPMLTVATTDVLFAGIAGNLIIGLAGAYVLLAACSMLLHPPGDPAQWLSVRWPWLIVILLSAVACALMFCTLGVHVQLLSFSSVNGVRAASIERAGGVLTYLLSWQANVFNPLFIIYGLRFLCGLPLMAAIVGDLLIYTITGYKSVLFSALTVVIFLLALRQTPSTAGSAATGVRIGFAAAALVAVATALGRHHATVVNSTRTRTCGRTPMPISAIPACLRSRASSPAFLDL